VKAPIAGVVTLTVAIAAGCSPAPDTPTAVVSIDGGHEFHVELATTPDQQRDGLSGRDALSQGTGMLFQFDRPAQHEVWMAGMKIPIDVAWISNGHVLAVDTLEPCTTNDQAQCPRWTSPSPADALLEVPAGSLEEITPGTAITIQEDTP
jgi:uncharacterized membrane protein (UPF0127 family)